VLDERRVRRHDLARVRGVQHVRVRVGVVRARQEPRLASSNLAQSRPHISISSRPHLRHISATSPPHLRHISTTSRPHLGLISTTSRPHLGLISTSSRPHLGHISTTSRPHLDHISASSRPHLGLISTTSRPHLDHISTTSRPHLGDEVSATQPRRRPASHSARVLVASRLGVERNRLRPLMASAPTPRGCVCVRRGQRGAAHAFRLATFTSCPEPAFPTPSCSLVTPSRARVCAAAAWSSCGSVAASPGELPCTYSTSS